MPKNIELEPIGTVLYEEFMEPNRLTAEDVANAISIPVWQITAIIENGVPMTAEIDLLLSKFFGMSSPGFFLRWQQHYDERLAKRHLRKKLSGVIPFAKLNRAAAL
jgi:addiction module HigA family antidote